MNHTSCCICTKSVSFQNIHKHIFSRAHEDNIKNALFKIKPSILLYIDKDKPISIYFKSPSKRYNICYPCKYLGSTMKPHVCDKGAENRKIIKEILTNMTELIKKDEVEVVEDSTSKKEFERVSAIAERVFDMEDALYGILSKLQESDFDSFKNEMITLKRDYPKAFEAMYKQLGGEEGEEGFYDEEG